MSDQKDSKIPRRRFLQHAIHIGRPQGDDIGLPAKLLEDADKLRRGLRRAFARLRIDDRLDRPDAFKAARCPQDARP